MIIYTGLKQTYINSQIYWKLFRNIVYLYFQSKSIMGSLEQFKPPGGKGPTQSGAKFNYLFSEPVTVKKKVKLEEKNYHVAQGVVPSRQVEYSNNLKLYIDKKCQDFWNRDDEIIQLIADTRTSIKNHLQEEILLCQRQNELEQELQAKKTQYQILHQRIFDIEFHTTLLQSSDDSSVDASINNIQNQQLESIDLPDQTYQILGVNGKKGHRCFLVEKDGAQEIFTHEQMVKKDPKSLLEFYISHARSLGHDF